MLRLVQQRVVSTLLVRVPAAVCTKRELSYEPRLRDTHFLLDMYGMYQHYKDIGASDAASKDVTEALLEECGKLCKNVLFPLNESGDHEGCTLIGDSSVTTPKGFKEAYRALVDGGWCGVCAPQEYGGQGLPTSLAVITREFMGTANWAFVGYPGLTGGAVSTLLAWGSDELKQAFLPKLSSGEWSGTMCLTEPQCGTDLAQVKTRAVKHADGSYRLTGTKIFITGGEHDLTENIVHIVLAKLPDAPNGTKGLSLFLVPRHVIEGDGTLSKEKNVKCVGLEKKMGIKASATCQMAFDESVGYLIGKEHDGMKEMFTFMNEARVGAALQGVAHAELAFQNALAYARQRRSMRALSGTKEPHHAADSIIHHPNVRHNILFCKVVAEGGRAMCLDMARLLDLQQAATDEKKRKALEEEVGFLTPIAKACLTEWGLEAASNGMQVFGGHGFIRGNGMEQIMRDARIATLYEGTTGVQALDFLGRKVLRTKTGEPARFGQRVSALCSPLLFKTGPLATCARTLWAMDKQWRFGVGILTVSAMGDKDSVGSASQDFLMYTGYIALGFYWLSMGIHAQKQIEAGNDADGFYRSKVECCTFYFERILPRSTPHFTIMSSPSKILTKPIEATWDL